MTLSADIVFDAIRSHIEAGWTATEAVAWENDGFWRRTVADPDVWEQFTTDAPVGQPWVLVEMQGTLYGQASIGADVQADNRWDEEGVLLIHAFVPAGTGARLARQIARAAANLFRGVTLDSGSIEFLDATMGLGEADEEGNFFRLTTSVDWRRCEP